MTIDPSQYEAAMWEKVTAIDRAQAAVLAARDAVDTARADAEAAVRDYGAALMIADQPVERALMHKLYWQHPAVRVTAIAEAFNVEHTAKVYQLVGPGQATGRCPGDCGRDVVLESRGSGPKACDDCRERQDAELEQRKQASAAAAAREEQEVRERLRAGATPEQLYAEYAERWEANGPMPMFRRLAIEELAREIGRPIP